MKNENITIKRALISVTDKTDLEGLVKSLNKNGVEIISTGGTKAFIEKLGVPVINIEDVTGNPEAFGGRMKSISFQITSGLLFRRYFEQDLVEANQLKIKPIDLVVCNLYPFQDYVGKNSSEDTLIENIDIGGPLMLRAASKNYEAVTVLSDVSDYKDFLDEFNTSSQKISFKTRRRLAITCFNRIAKYDCLIAEELTERFMKEESNTKSFMNLSDEEVLRYGENPHQWAKKYQFLNTTQNITLSKAEFIQGKELSFNNWVDADAAWRVMSDVAHISKDRKVVSIIKHANPCGLAVSSSTLGALEEAWSGDSVSSFGGIIAFSHEVDDNAAQFFKDKFIEVIIAPNFTTEALALFSKKKNVRLLKSPIRPSNESELIIKSISGGLLIQNEDESSGKNEELKNVTNEKLSNEYLELADFGILACKHLKSNGIALVMKTENGNFSLVGAGMGQPNRLDSLRLLAQVRSKQKNLDLSKMLLISDAFFPFSDSIEVCHDVGIKSIIQPGGSIRDDEVIEACNKFGISMAFTGRRHFRH
jgi:phosphoribosylaminoimidazolecarboxamide formyltransferase/IMP cyclohydrolase